MNGTLTRSLRRILEQSTQAAGVPLRVFQGSYSTSVGASAGTHAGGGAFDLDIRMMNRQQRLQLIHELRKRGCAAWIRTPEYGYHAPPAHIHGICRTESGLSPAARQQVIDYDNGLNGLANRGRDPHPRPGHTITDEDDDMTPEQDKLLKTIAARTDYLANKVEQGTANSRIANINNRYMPEMLTLLRAIASKVGAR